MPRIVPFYAALLALLFIALAFRVIRERVRARVGVGDAGDPMLLRAMRVHANFAEYVPLALLLLAFMELQGTAAALLHGLCVALLAGRLSHAFGVSRQPEPLLFRRIGMGLTFAVMGVAAGSLVTGFVTG